MKLVPQSEIDLFQFNYVEPTMFIELSTLVAKNGGRHKFLLVVTPGRPSYVFVSYINDKWYICPWLDDRMMDMLIVSCRPSEMVTRLPEELALRARNLQSLSPVVRVHEVPPSPQSPDQGPEAHRQSQP